MTRFSSATESDTTLSIKIPEMSLQTLEIHGEKTPIEQSKEEEEEENPWLNIKKNKKKNQVCLEGYVGGESEEIQEQGSNGFSRTKSLTGEDLDELKGCLDLGFGFSYEEIPELCNTLPALELCYSMSQRFLDDQHKSSEVSDDADAEVCSSSPIANWKISSPGDHPEEVKARLKFWAQAVACTVKLCS